MGMTWLNQPFGRDEGVSSSRQLNAMAAKFLLRRNDLTRQPSARAEAADLIDRAQPLFNADHRPEGTL